MMTIDDIRTLIVADESRTLELKKTTGELKDGMHSACAFLNTEGGWLIFGVAPSSLKNNRTRGNRQDSTGDCPGFGRPGTCSGCASGVC
mgnify:CR=1 FL=1